jgi:hypothetical protein
MLQAFHRDRVAAAEGVMREEADRALAGWRDGAVVEVYGWARRLALRVALRALFGIDPDAARRAGEDPARDFEQALAFFGHDYWLQVLRGPGTPWAAMLAARGRLDRLVNAEIARRRRTGAHGEDVLSLLLDARDEDDRPLDDATVRDEVMTLLFAGHDTTTATVSFLLHEVAGHPDLDAAAQLDQVIDETLRLWLAAFDPISPEDDPADALAAYIRRKMRLSFEHPLASRVFAQELLRGAPVVRDFLAGELKAWVEARSAVIRVWIARGRMAPLEPAHLFFTIWAATQTYADFDAQITAVLGRERQTAADREAATEQLVRLVLRGCGLEAP